MNTMHMNCSFVSFKPSSRLVPPCSHSPLRYTCGCYHNTILNFSRPSQFPFTSRNSSFGLQTSVGVSIPSNQETISEAHFEDFVEKDWSFLEANSDGEHMHNIDRIISAGGISETSKVMVSIGSEAFVDRLVSSSPCEQLLVVHDSLFVLACIKEQYDKVKCWQGELINVPEKWTSFDVVFLYFLPALPFELGEILAALAKRCLPGARIVISHPQGRHMVEEQRKLYAEVFVSSLPEKLMLQSVAAENSFEVAEFVDEPGLYLAVLKLDSNSEK